MDIALWLAHLQLRLEKVSALNLGYPPGEHIVVPPLATSLLAHLVQKTGQPIPWLSFTPIAMVFVFPMFITATLFIAFTKSCMVLKLANQPDSPLSLPRWL